MLLPAALCGPTKPKLFLLNQSLTLASTCQRVHLLCISKSFQCFISVSPLLIPHPRRARRLPGSFAFQKTPDPKASLCHPAISFPNQSEIKTKSFRCKNSQLLTICWLNRTDTHAAAAVQRLDGHAELISRKFFGFQPLTGSENNFLN